MSAATNDLFTATEPAPAPVFGWAAPKTRPWRTAWLLPLLVAVPWLVLMRGVGTTTFYAGLAGMLFCLLGTTATITDLLWRRIYNWATYPAIVWLLGLQLVVAVVPEPVTVADPSFRAWSAASESVAQTIPTLFALPALGDSIVGLVLGFGVMFVLYSIFGGGAGDLKLMTAYGALLGANQVLMTLAFGYILAGVVAGCYLLWVIGVRGMMVGIAHFMGLLPRDYEVDPAWKATLAKRMPMAPFFTVGAIIALANMPTP